MGIYFKGLDIEDISFAFSVIVFNCFFAGLFTLSEFCPCL